MTSSSSSVLFSSFFYLFFQLVLFFFSQHRPSAILSPISSASPFTLCKYQLDFVSLHPLYCIFTMVSFSRYISSPSFRFVSHISVSTFELFYPLFPQRKLRKRRIFLNSSFSASTFFVHASIVPHFSVDCSLRFFIRNSLPPFLGLFLCSRLLFCSPHFLLFVYPAAGEINPLRLHSYRSFQPQPCFLALCHLPAFYTFLSICSGWWMYSDFLIRSSHGWKNFSNVRNT